MKRFQNPKTRFFTVIVIAHVLAYLLAGGISYQLVMKDLWDAPETILSNYLRTPGEKELWNFAMIWQVPGQIVRGILMAMVLLLVFAIQTTWSGSRKILFFSSLVFVFSHMSSSAPSPANIEGLVYIKPEFIQLGFFKMQVEMILYSITFGAIVSKFGNRTTVGA